MHRYNSNQFSVFCDEWRTLDRAETGFFHSVAVQRIVGVFLYIDRQQQLIDHPVEPDRRKIRYPFLDAESFARIAEQSHAVPNRGPVKMPGDSRAF
jgi:hypothetical protein